MPIVIVPDALYDAIQKKLDAAIAEHPDAEKDRDHLYHQLLDYYYEHGVIPDFAVQARHGPGSQPFSDRRGDWKEK